MLDIELAREVAGEVSATIQIAFSSKDISMQCASYTGTSLAPTATVYVTDNTNLK